MLRDTAVQSRMGGSSQWRGLRGAMVMLLPSCVALACTSDDGRDGGSSVGSTSSEPGDDDEQPATSAAPTGSDSTGTTDSHSTSVGDETDETSSGPSDGPLIPADQLFVLSAEERLLFTPPPSWIVEWGTAFEDYPLRNLWEAFDAGLPVEPLDPEAGPQSWYQPDGAGSQNHSLLWLGVSALGCALHDDVAGYELAAGLALDVLALDELQGHMRHEAVGGYAGFWQGGIATMALAGLYAPDGTTSGPMLLQASRAWWADHVAVLRRLRVEDGQVVLIGARLAGEPGNEDDWSCLSAAVNQQLVDPRPHAALHPTIAALVTANGSPAAGMAGIPIRWHRPRHVAERWIVLRALQSGALQETSAEHAPPSLVQQVYRWSEGNRIHFAIPEVTGYRPARWQASWAPGSTVRVENGDPGTTPHTGKGPHEPPDPLTIPPGAELILGP